jgi:sugar phosphate permease
MKPRIFYGWWIVFACFFLSLYISSVILFGFTAFFEPLVQEFGWSYTQISLASSLRGLEMGILSPFIGFLVTRFGSRKLILSGVITVGIGWILMSYTQSLLMFYCSMLFVSFGAGGCTAVVTMTAVARWFRKNIGKALGIMSSGFGASGLLIPGIVWIIDTYGWRTALIIFGLGIWLIGIPLAFVIRDSPDKYGYLPDGASVDDPAVQDNPQDKEPAITIRELFKERTLLYLNLAESIRFMCVVAVMTHIMPYMSSIGMPRSSAGFIAAAIPLISIGGRFVFGWVGDIYDKRYVTSVAFCFMAFGTLALAFANLKLGLFLFLIFFPSGFGAISVLRGTIVREYYGINSFGIMMGIMMGFGAAGGIIGPTLAGFVFDTLESYHLAWSGFSLLLIIAIALVLKIRPHVQPAVSRN